jgi:tetratricopeptide (TPR) repeat protein
MSQGWGEVSGEELTEAVTLARSSLAAGKEDPETLWMAGVALAGLAGERAAAINAIDRSLALNPNSAQAWNAIGWMRCASEPEVAIEALERAMRLSPLDPYRWMFYGGLAFAHLTAGRYEDAMGWVDRALLEQPGVLAMVRLKIVLCGCLDRRDEARRWLARLREAQPGLTIAGFKEFASARFLSPKALDFYVEGLRRAGLEEA